MDNFPNSTNLESFRNIIELIKNTLDVSKTKNTIIEAVCKTLGADRCFIVDYDNSTNRFLPIKYEYLASKNVSSCIGQDVHEIVPGMIDAVKAGKTILVKDREIFLEPPEKDFETEQDTFRKYDVHSIFAVPMFYQDDLLGVLSVHYTKSGQEIGKFEMNLVTDIANQSVVAVHLANLYKLNQIQLERAELLRKVIETSRKSLILDEVLFNICKEIVELFKIQRVSIAKVFPETRNESELIGEYRANENIREFKSHTGHAQLAQYWTNYLNQGGGVKLVQNIIQSDLPENVIKIYNELGVKSIACIPLKYGDESLWGGLFLSGYDLADTIIKDEIRFFQTIASQTCIAIKQAESYQKEKESASREALLRNTVELIRSTIDIDELKTTVVAQIAKTLKADRCFIMEFDNNKKIFIPVEYEYLSSSEIKSIKGFDLENEIPEFARRNRISGIVINDLEQYLAKNNFFGTVIEKHFVKYDVQAGFSIPIFHADKMLGLLAIHYCEKKGKFIEDEVKLVEALASQIGIAINQAELYKQEILAKERERMSSGIIEILRKSLDKTMIKKLFVKNIRKFFEADIVYLADYSFEENMYKPVDKNSEALSNYSETSFIGYDWSNKEANEYIQPLLNREELNVFDVEAYHQEDVAGIKLAGFFEKNRVKSSYNFPVLHQQDLIGFLSINFTDSIYILSKDDISKLRDICTQLGVALNQAGLYSKAQQCFFSKGELLEKVSEKVESASRSVLYEITHLSKNDEERELQISNLSGICENLINSIKQME